MRACAEGAERRRQPPTKESGEPLQTDLVSLWKTEVARNVAERIAGSKKTCPRS